MGKVCPINANNKQTRYIASLHSAVHSQHIEIAHSSTGHCKTWTLDSGLAVDWTMDWTRDDHFQFSVRRLEWLKMPR